MCGVRLLEMDRYLMVFVGGALGSVARYWVASALVSKFGPGMPLATFTVNITGSFLIGFLAMSLAGKNDLLRLALMTGFLGGYTTFSAFELEIFLALKAGEFRIAVLYPLLSLVAGLIAVSAGAAIATKRLVP